MSPQVKKYKVLLSILVKHMEGFTKPELDNYMKKRADLSGSCKDFTQDEMQELIEKTYGFVVTMSKDIGLTIDENDNIIKTK